MVNIVLAILIFSATLYWDVNDDYKKWLKNKPVKHGKELIPRFLFLSPSIALFLLPNFSYLQIPVVILMELSVWLLLFDGFYNSKRGFDWWFLGSTDPDDAKTDIVQRKIPLKWLKRLKIGIPVLLICLYIISLYIKIW